MSFDPKDPNNCPTCQLPFDYAEAEAGCNHRKTYSAHLAFALGQAEYNVPWANREPIPDPRLANPYPEDSDEACWWNRGFSYVARLANQR